jgi:hypothetical protein
MKLRFSKMDGGRTGSSGGVLTVCGVQDMIRMDGHFHTDMGMSNQEVDDFVQGVMNACFEGRWRYAREAERFNVHIPK